MLKMNLSQLTSFCITWREMPDSMFGSMMFKKMSFRKRMFADVRECVWLGYIADGREGLSQGLSERLWTLMGDGNQNLNISTLPRRFLALGFSPDLSSPPPSPLSSSSRDYKFYRIRCLLTDGESENSNL